MTDWDERWFQVAHLVASWSKDPDRQVGAVVVAPDNRQCSMGYNGLPRGLDELESYQRLSNETKNSMTVHAELNAILNSVVDITGWTIYCTRFPCLHCAIAIRQKKLARLVCPGIEPNSKWVDSQFKAYGMLTDLGIEIVINSND